MTKPAPAKPAKGFGTRIWEFFCSVKLAIFTLITLAITSIIGTVIPQQLSPEEYLKKMSQATYDFYSMVGLTDVYRTWWFQALLLLLSINLIVCSINRFPYTWRMIARPTKDLDEDSLPTYQLREKFSQRDSIENLRKRYTELTSAFIGQPQITEREDGGFSFFVENGKYARLGVYVVHLSVIVILAGALIGVIWGIKGMANVEEGKQVDNIWLRQENFPAYPLGFTVRCDDFDVSFYENGAPKEFRSDLVIIENGKEVMKKRIKVNHPLTYKGFTFYQASYGPTDPLFAIDVRDRKAGATQTVVVGMNSGIQNLPDGTGFQITNFAENFATEGQSYGPAAQVSLYRPGQPPSTFVILQNYPQLDESRNGAQVFSIRDIKQGYYTGLQVTKDPGVWVVYLGCIVMVLGFYQCFFMSHRRFWVTVYYQDGKATVLAAGSTNKNRDIYAKEFKKVVSQMKGEEHHPGDTARG